LFTTIEFASSIAVLVISILDATRLSKSFGKEPGFTFGLILLPILFYPMLAFGDAQYQEIEG
ncbi:MAG: DUF5684 domain-containing protein, partial [Flavobacteriales bacterium]